MAWVRAKVSPLILLSTESDVSVMIKNCMTGKWFDWSNSSWVDLPKTILQPMTKAPFPAIQGVIQRFEYMLDTTKFPDGRYGIFYCKPSGEYVEEYFNYEFVNVIDGSMWDVMPVKTISMKFES